MMNATARCSKLRYGASEVIAALRGVDLNPTDTTPLRFDGVLCRYRSDGDGAGKRNAWLVAHLDGNRPVIVCGSWRTGEQHTIALDGEPVGQAERGRIRAMLEAARAERDRETRMRQASAQKLANRWWDSSMPADLQHPYLLRKRIGVHGARTSGGKLLVAMRDENGDVWNIQAIRPDGEKRFLAGARIRGLAARIGDDGDHSHILLAEGFATAASLHEATGLPVYAAMTASNLQRVAEWLRSKYPASTITVCADNDSDTEAKTGCNVGVESAKQAAACIGGRLAIPPCAGDWNDHATKLNGANALTENTNDGKVKEAQG